MPQKISQLKSYNTFKSFLYRHLKGCLQLHLDKLINHLYLSFVNDFGIDRAAISSFTKKEYFGDRIGMKRWLTALETAQVITRTKRNVSTFRIASKGIKYLDNIYKESIAIAVQTTYTAQKAVVSTDTEEIEGKEVEKLAAAIIQLEKKIDLLTAKWTPEEVEEVERHLTLVPDDK